MEISQEALANTLQIGAQYFLPAAALLRALYSGIRGKFPEGVVQILLASAFAGLTAILDNQTIDLRRMFLEILGNTVFMAGLLTFIMTYLLRMQNRGKIVDSIVGGVLGLIGWLVWTQVLLNDWTWWTAPLTIIGGAVAFVVLRGLLLQIGRLVKIATYLIVIALFFMTIAIGVYLFQQLTQAPV